MSSIKEQATVLVKQYLKDGDREAFIRGLNAIDKEIEQGNITEEILLGLQDEQLVCSKPCSAFRISIGDCFCADVMNRKKIMWKTSDLVFYINDKFAYIKSGNSVTHITRPANRLKPLE
jgi:hypothetical protein